MHQSAPDTQGNDDKRPRLWSQGKISLISHLTGCAQDWSTAEQEILGPTNVNNQTFLGHCGNASTFHIGVHVIPLQPW